MPAITVGSGNRTRTSTWEQPASGNSVLEIQYQPKPWAFKGVPDAQNYLIPPIHYHWYQDEYFKVTKGTYVLTRNHGPWQTKTTVSSTDAENSITIPAGQFHTFAASADSTEPCSIEISASTVSPSFPFSIFRYFPLLRWVWRESNPGITERYFRNVYAYRDDCEKQGVPPRLLQLLLMQHYAQISIIPKWVPLWAPDIVKRWAGWFYGFVIGVLWGKWVCGMRASYGEYFDEKGGERVKKA